jgi:hypothetical protein
VRIGRQQLRQDIALGADITLMKTNSRRAMSDVTNKCCHEYPFSVRFAEKGPEIRCTNPDCPNKFIGTGNGVMEAIDDLNAQVMRTRK